MLSRLDPRPRTNPRAPSGGLASVAADRPQLLVRGGDQIAIASGVKPGEEIVTSGVFKLRNGAAVVVNNKVRPDNNPAPRPENS